MSDKITSLLRSKAIAYILFFVVVFQVGYPLVSNTTVYAQENMASLSIDNKVSNDGDNLGIITTIDRKDKDYTKETLTYELPESVEFISSLEGQTEVKDNQVVITTFGNQVSTEFGITGSIKGEMKITYRGTDSNGKTVTKETKVSLTDSDMDMDTFFATSYEYEGQKQAKSGSLDYGDAPESYGSAGVGSGAILRPSGAISGHSYSDFEASPQYSLDATGDDATGHDDENGIDGSGPTDIYFSIDDNTWENPDTSETEDEVFEVGLNTVGAGQIGIWIDQDGNGVFDADEGRVQGVGSGVARLGYIYNPENINRRGAADAISGVAVGDTFMRIRYIKGAAPMTKADAATDFGSNVGSTQDYLLHLKAGKAYSGYNHLVLNPKTCDASGGSFLYEGIKYGGSPTDEVDIKITPKNQTEGNIIYACSDNGYNYTGWYTDMSYKGDLAFESYVSTDSSFNEDIPIAMNLTFTVSDMDYKDEVFSFPKDEFTEGENFGFEASNGSDIGLASSNASTYRVQADTMFNNPPTGENNAEEWSTAWTTIQTSDDPANPTTFYQGAELSHGRVIQANLSIGGPLISTFTGYPYDSVAPNVELEEQVNYVAELGGIKYDEMPTVVDRVEIYFDDPLLDETSITNVKLLDEIGNPVCNGGAVTGTQTISCAPGVDIDVVTDPNVVDNNKLVISLDSSLPTTEILQYDVSYDITVEDQLDNRDPDGNKINDPYLMVLDDSTVSGDKIHANELKVQKPTDLTGQLTAEYTVDDGQLPESEAVCLTKSLTKSIEVNGCAEHGETLNNDIVITNNSGYAQALTIDVKDYLDNQNVVDGNNLANANLKVTDQTGTDLTLGTDYTINATNPMEVDFTRPLKKGEAFTIHFNSKVDLTSSNMSDKYILNQANVGTTDNADLNGDGTPSNLELINSNNFYVAWYDDTVNGFDVTMTAEDTDVMGPNASGYDPSDADAVAEPNEYIDYKIQIVNTGMLDQTNVTIDLSAFDDLNLDTTTMEYCIDSSDSGEDCDAAYTGVSGNNISVGSIASGATVATATNVYVRIPTVQALDYSQADDIITVQTATISSDSITSQGVTNTEEIPLIDISEIGGLEISKTVTDTGLFSDGLANPDESLHYTITVSNTGYSNIPNYTVEDDLNDADLVKGTAGDISNVKVNGSAATNEVADDSSFKVTVNDVLDPLAIATIEFDINALDIFDASDVIDTTANVDTSTISATESTTYTPGSGTYYDIEKDMNINPTDPIDPDKPIDPTNPQNVIFTKEVTDIDGNNNNKAEPEEALHYKYTITNTLPVRANVALKNVVLKDDLTTDVDVNNTITNLTVTGATTTSTDVVSGIELGDITSGDTVVVEFDTTAASTFDPSDAIDTTALLTADNFVDASGNSVAMPEDDTIATGMADIEKNMEIDPTDPIDPDKPVDPTNPQNVLFTKEVTELTGDGDGKADPAETLHYEYTVENTLPIRANVAMQDVVLKDNLNVEPDLDLSSISNIEVNGVANNTADIVAGINLGDILSGQNGTVSFDIDTTATFSQVNGINSKARVTANNISGMTILESYDSATGTYADVVPDIDQDLMIDPIDPDGNVNVEFTKEVTDPDGDNDEKADPAEILHYKYTLRNNADKVIRNAKLKDIITNEPDLDTTDLSNVSVTITMPDGAIINAPTTMSVQDIVDGVVLGNVEPSKTMILEFDLSTNSTFVDTTAINSAAVISSPVLSTPVKELYDPSTSAYKDMADIKKDNSITNDQISFTKTVVNENGNSEALPGDILDYTYTITNTSPVTFNNLNIKDDLTEEADLDFTASTPITLTTDDANYTGPTNPTLGNLKSGINLGTLGAGKMITLEVAVPTTTVFTTTDEINSEAQVTLNNMTDIVKEQFDGTSYTDVNPDFYEDTNIDPTDPIDPGKPIDPSNPQNVLFTKEVTDVDGNNNNKAEPEELLHYKYVITNTLPVRANVVLENVVLTDVLTTTDPDVSSAITNLNVTGATTTSTDITSGIELGNIASGDTVTVEFDTTAASTFDATPEINTTAFLSADNFIDNSGNLIEMPEDDTIATGMADIEKNMEIDPTDPIDPDKPTDPQNVTLVKEVTDVNGNNDGVATTGEALHYTYTITNNSAIAALNVSLVDDLTTDLDVTTTISNLNVTGATATGDILTGLSLGNILSGNTVTVEFDTLASSTFDTTDTINTESLLSADNFVDNSGNSIDLPEDDSAAGVNADIAKDNSTDPTNPDNAITFTKSVTDPAGNNDNTAQTNEQLHYVYTVKNMMPVRSDVVLENVILTDDLVSEGLSGTVSNLKVDGVLNSGDITTGLNLGDIDVNQTVTVEFDTITNPSFTTTDPINTTALLTANNFVDSLGNSIDLPEDDSAAVVADIAKDQTGSHLIDDNLLTHQLCYVDSSAPTTPACTTTEGVVVPNDYVGYKLAIDNTGSYYDHTITLSREANTSSVPGLGGDTAGDYEITNNFIDHTTVNSSGTTESGATVTIPAGSYFEIEYADLLGAFTDSEPITNTVNINDSIDGTLQSTLEVEKDSNAGSYGKLEAISGNLVNVAGDLNNQIYSSPDPIQTILTLADVHGLGSDGNPLTINSSNTQVYSYYDPTCDASQKLCGQDSYGNPVEFPATGTYILAYVYTDPLTSEVYIGGSIFIVINIGGAPTGPSSQSLELTDNATSILDKLENTIYEINLGKDNSYYINYTGDAIVVTKDDSIVKENKEKEVSTIIFTKEEDKKTKDTTYKFVNSEDSKISGVKLTKKVNKLAKKIEKVKKEIKEELEANEII